MLLYTEYHINLDSSTGVEDALTDVADDLRGLAGTLSSLSEAPGYIDNEQAKVLGDVAGFISQAVDSILVKLYRSPEAEEVKNA